MEEIFLQLGVGGMLAVIILEKSIGLIKWLIEKNKNGNGKKNNNQDEAIARYDERIKNIELQVSNHIQSTLKDHGKDLQNIKIDIAKILQKLEIK